MDRFFYTRIQSHELQLYSDSPESVSSDGVICLDLADEAASEPVETAE